MDILVLVILFEITLQNSMKSGNNGFPIAVFFFHVGFANDMWRLSFVAAVSIGLFVKYLLDLIMNDQIVEILGWLGFALVSMGYYFNAKKKLYCFYIWGLGNAVYILYGFIISAFPIIAMSVFVLGMNIYGYLNWVKDS